MSKPEICRWCKWWDVEGKFLGGIRSGSTGKCHCNKMWQDTRSDESCSNWEMDYSRTEDQLERLRKVWGVD